MRKATLRLPRVPARPHPLGAWIVYRGLVRPSLRRMFNRVLLDESTLPAVEPVLQGAAPVLCYATHVSWWDGYLAFELFRKPYPRRHFLMMEEAQLRRYFFFRWCGCFSVDRSDPREGMRSLTYAADLLRTQRRALVWLFPQGMIAPADRRPLQLYRGAAQIAIRSGGAWCVPVALRYEFGAEQRPDALIRLGAPLWVDAQSQAATLEATLAHELTLTADALRDRWLAGDFTTAHSILQGRASTNRLFDAALEPLKRIARRFRRF